MADYALQVSESELHRYRMMAEVAQRSEADLWELAGIGPGAAVADIGCGPGAVSALLATRVGPAGRVAAVDADPGVLAVARESLGQTGAQNWTAQAAPADATGLDPGSFDVVMIRHVLAHNGATVPAIVAHAVTLLRPGGVLYLVDVDLTTTKMHPIDAELADLLPRYVDFHRGQGNNPEIGLELFRLLQDAGLEVIAYRGRIDIVEAPPGMRPPPWAAREAMVAAGIATATDVARWQAALERSDTAQPRPMVFPTMFMALGRRC